MNGWLCVAVEVVSVVCVIAQVSDGLGHWIQCVPLRLYSELEHNTCCYNTDVSVICGVWLVSTMGVMHVVVSVW